jgi:hypothetical protein
MSVRGQDTAPFPKTSVYDALRASPLVIVRIARRGIRAA